MSNSAATQPPASKESAENGTISRLIWQLKYSYRPSDFEKVIQTLNARDESRMRDVSFWKSEYESMEKKHGEINLEKLNSDDELDKCRRERDLLKAQVARAGKDQRVLIDRLEEDQKVLVARFKEDHKVYIEREKNSQERYTKLWEEFTEVETEKRSLSYEVSSLKFEKEKAERELESCKRRFEELNQRILRLEDVTAMVMSRGPEVEDKREDVAEVVVAADELVMDAKEAENGDETGSDNLPEPRLKERGSNCLEKANSLPGGGTAADSMEFVNNHRENGYMVIIEIDDSDDEMPTRKRGLCNEDNDVKPTDKRHRRSLEELIKGIHDSSVSSDTGDSSSSGSDIDTKSVVARVRREVVENKSWAFKADMISALKREPKLCMTAVCALYQKQIYKVESVSVSSLSTSQVFNQFDAFSRGTSLGKYLTDDDPQGKLKRSVAELKEYDPNGLNDCKKLALRYADQLFEMYQKKEDAFFVPS